MTSSDYELSESENEKSEKKATEVGNYYKCCVKKLCKTQICIKCDSMYHSSCAKRKNFEIINRAHVMCCEKGKVVGKQNHKESQSDQISEVKIEYLEKIITELKEKNDLLKENNQILKENNRLLVERIGSLEKNQNKAIKYSEATKKKRADDKQTAVSSRDIERQTPKDNYSHYSEEKNQIGQPNLQPSINKIQKQKTDSIFEGPKEVLYQKPLGELKESDETSDPGDNNNYNYTTVRSRRYRKRRLGTGNASKEELEGGFAGPERKVWLNIYRVNSHVTADMVEKHIRKQPGFLEEIIKVSELQTKTHQLKSFVVTAPLQRKDEMYESSFWPPNVGIRRFKFDTFKNSGGHFL